MKDLDDDFDVEITKKLSKLRRKNIDKPKIVRAKIPELKKLTWNPVRKQVKGLSPEQTDFVKSNDRNVLLVSTAGSGKTRSLTSRVIDLINNKDVDPERILLITFTVKAGEEMRLRVSDALGSGIAKFITCGTFHSFAVRMLRKFTPDDIPRNFSILDSSDAYDTWMKCAEMGHCMIGHTKALFSRYSVMRNCEMSDEEAILDKWPNMDNKQIKNTLISFNRTIKIYTQYKKKYSMYDFDDLLEILENSLFENKKFRMNVSSLYDYVLIDEIQDCNAQQLSIIKGLVKGNVDLRKANKSISKISIYGVGDPSQSIYHFRGADHHLMESFPEMFHAKVASLVTNYRSTSQILNLANAVGENFTSVRWKNKMIGTYNGEKPYYVRIQDEHLQTDFVVKYVEEWIRKKKVPGREIAILYRSNSTATPFEIALTQKGILFEKRGGQSLFEMAHIKDILAFFKAAYYASDVIAWNRVLQLHKGIGAKLAQKIYSKALEEDSAPQYLINQKEYKHLCPLGKLLKDLLKYNKNISEAIELIFNYSEKILRTKYGETWNTRSSSVRAFFNVISRMSSIKKMLTELALNSNGQNLKDSKESDKQGGRVILSTVHSFKGLEANNVFLVNITDSKFPSDFFVYDGKIPLDKKTNPPDLDKLDEERRLFYVACTRARHNLIIVSPMSDKEYTDFTSLGVIKDEHNTESQFIQEIDIDSLANVLMPVKESDTIKNPQLKKLYDEYE